VKKVKADTKKSEKIIQYATTIKSGLMLRISTNLLKSFVRGKQEYAITSLANMGIGANRNLEIDQARLLRVVVRPETRKHDIFCSCGCHATSFSIKISYGERAF